MCTANTWKKGSLFFSNGRTGAEEMTVERTGGGCWAQGPQPTQAGSELGAEVELSIPTTHRVLHFDW